MYAPHQFSVTDSAEIEAALAAVRLGCLVTHDAEGLTATHMPFLYDHARHVLTGHIARANPHWRRAGDADALAIFQGPNAYISPSWYQAKQETGRVVPTWNYEAIHVHGRAAWTLDPEWLIAQVSALSDRHEASRDQPWAVSDAPADYIRRMADGIVGLELSIERVEVTRKMSQNRPAADQAAVVGGLSSSPAESDRAMAEAMRRALGFDA
jgi:transcriptional regulator